MELRDLLGVDIGEQELDPVLDQRVPGPQGYPVDVRVEQFLKSASPREQEDFFELVRKGNIGISATYLNFNDLADADMLNNDVRCILS